MKKILFKGCGTAISTPFCENGVNTEEFSRLIENQIQNKVDAILDDTKKKLDNLDGVFNLVDTVSNKLTLVTDTVVGSIVNFITSIFNRKGKGDIDE